MAAQSVVEYPSPILRQVAALVTKFDSRLAALATDLTDTLMPTTGIGISAPQLGHAVRVVLLDLSERSQPPQVYVNPQLISKSGFGIIQESCLSLPGIKGNVIRATNVQVRAFDLEGVAFERQLEGMAAVAMLHELDHLEGVLFIDRLTLPGRLRYKWSQRRAAIASAQAA